MNVRVVRELVTCVLFPNRLCLERITPDFQTVACEVGTNVFATRTWKCSPSSRI